MKIDLAIKEIRDIYPIPIDYKKPFCGPTYVLVGKSQESIYREYLPVDQIYIFGLHVKTKNRGQGIGSGIMKTIFNIADKYNLDVYGRVQSVNSQISLLQLADWYGKIGMHPTIRVKDNIWIFKKGFTATTSPGKIGV